MCAIIMIGVEYHRGVCGVRGLLDYIIYISV